MQWPLEAVLISLYTMMRGHTMAMQLFSTGVRSCRHSGVGVGLKILSDLNHSILALPWPALHFPFLISWEMYASWQFWHSSHFWDSMILNIFLVPTTKEFRSKTLKKSSLARPGKYAVWMWLRTCRGLGCGYSCEWSGSWACISSGSVECRGWNCSRNLPSREDLSSCRCLFVGWSFSCLDSLLSTILIPSFFLNVCMQME